MTKEVWRGFLHLQYLRRLQRSGAFATEPASWRVRAKCGYHASFALNYGQRLFEPEWLFECIGANQKKPSLAAKIAETGKTMLAQTPTQEDSMNLDYIGFDVHKKSISFCAKAQDGRILDEGKSVARRSDLDAWVQGRSRPWIGALEATLFTGWIYDQLRPMAQELKVAHPAMLKAIAASKKKNDRIDARKIADLLRCNLLPECYMASSRTRQLRRLLRYRNLVVRQATRMKNRIAGLLMETGTPYNKQRLHGKAYFSELLGRVQETPASVRGLLRISRSQVELFETIQRKLVQELRGNSELAERVERLMSIDGVGEIVALTWVRDWRGEPLFVDWSSPELLRADERAK